MECCVGLGRAQQGERVRDPGRAWAGDGAGELPTTPEGFRRWDDAQHPPAGTPVAPGGRHRGVVSRAGVEQISALL